MTRISIDIRIESLMWFSNLLIKIINLAEISNKKNYLKIKMN
jgi:hypothetical protein